MLDSDTRRHIDAARDVLVGKVPDPKAQVEQITTALIYKFMDDMDRDAQRLGGHPSFFVNGYEKYAWTHLLDPRMGGQERLNLYAEALTLMSQNPHLPQLFRDIFKDAFLPYRDPATLNLFLKEINAFTYDHSENLGDAFEYLLSVLSSQGDAGQFRTPRHIIDFMVGVIDPQKDETILDPACGTAGFLISAYRHILHANAGHTLTPDEKKRLTDNLVGYDISPDMVRLSLVNMYLHSFPSPHIYEYDTLASEDRWDDKFDILMANPPFMSPKGGIRPHKRFQVPANRSEVLFVDYIAEHLRPHGRAAVIVPEGIIFQSANAYKLLRKSLVESWGLWAVVSLPAGVFNPYSGVKTSILFVDKDFARTTDEMLFAKVENDGFDLGAQRRAIEANDLPTLQGILQAWHSGTKQDDPHVQWVTKGRIAASGDYNLTGDRYKEVEVSVKTKWPMVKLGDTSLFQIEAGGTPASDQATYWDGDIAWVTLADLPVQQLITTVASTQRRISRSGLQHSAAKLLPAGTVLVSSRATIGRIGIAQTELATNQGFKNIVVKDHLRALPQYVAYVMTHMTERMQQLASGGTFREISKSSMATLEIPLPPLDVQQRIVAELDRYQRIIDGANQIIANWRPTFDVDSSWPIVTLGDVCEIDPSKTEIKGLDPHTVVSFVPMEMIGATSRHLLTSRQKPVSEVIRKGYTYFRDGDVILAKVTPCFQNGKAGIAQGLSNGIGFGTTELIVLRPRSGVLPEILYSYVSDPAFLAEGQRHMTGTGGLQRVSKEFVRNYQVRLPPLDVQQAIVDDMNRQEKVMESCEDLVSKYETKISAKIAGLWGESSVST